jgi:hypothetical protein
MSAAKNAYNAVSKSFIAKAFPGKAFPVEKIERIEGENPDCAAEFEFQLSSLKLLDGFAGKTLSYPLFADKQ